MTDKQRKCSSIPAEEAGALPHTSYLICATERVGSYVLADALAGTGIAGRPAEFFHRSHVQTLSCSPRAPSGVFATHPGGYPDRGGGSRVAYERYFSHVVQAGTTANGIWGGKIHWSHLERLILDIRQVPGLRNLDAPTLLEGTLPNLRYIRLSREDRVRQAISLFRARRTGVWWLLDGSEEAQSATSLPEPSFDFAAISRLLAQIEAHEAAWHDYFAACGAKPLVLSYEGVAADLPAAVRQVLGYIGLDVPADFAVPRPRFKKQADGLSEAWAERFHRAQQAESAASTFPATSNVGRAARGQPESVSAHHADGAVSRTCISVVVVSHNEGDHLPRTVQSLLPSLPPDGEIIVVDDCSTDGSAEQLLGRYQRVRVLRPDERLGVARGRNFGANCARGEVLVFSDAHVDVPGDWIRPLLAALADPGVGVVAPGISAYGAPDQKGYGGYWTDDGALRWRWGGWQGPDPHPIPLVCGCFMAMRRATFDAVGGFDNGFVLWGQEDAELSIRLWTLGYTCLLVPAVDVSHLFRPSHHYHIDWETVLHNMLRLAVIHFRQERIDRLLDHARANGAFPAAWERLTASDAWERRAVIQAARRHDDTWFFDRFGMA